MERIFWIILLVWVIFRITLMSLSLKGNTDPIAKEHVTKFFSEKDIESGKNYALHGFWVKMILPFLTIALMVILMKNGTVPAVFNRIEQWAGSDSFWLKNLLFLLLFTAFLEAISLPFSYYLDFLSEKEFGFSNLTSFQWFLRHIKFLIVGLVIESAGLMMVLWFFKTFERSWPFIVPIGITVYGIFITLLFPYLITPLFYNQKPISDGPLKEKILQIAEKAGITVSGIYELDESRYSNHTNAYFTGLFSEKRIVLYDTLIKSHTVDEAALIFAHEAGHWKHDHVFKGMAMGFVGSFLTCLLIWWIFPFLQCEKLFCLKELYSAQNLPFVYIVFSVFSLFCAPMDAQISQYFERQADMESLKLTGLTKIFINAEVRLALDNKADLLPHPYRVFWLYSHPPTIERIAMAENFEKEANTTNSQNNQ
ncbi:MAG: M48 family metallopeptidase [Candidatus Riflebacteria bacterium]|nr:M48 family metallopeptidase [Candidatus Riflebacteria bacterium]